MARESTLKIPKQKQPEPGYQGKMMPEPETIRENYRGSGKLEGKAALITGGDSGIGRSVAVHFAREGSDIAIAYLSEHEDAEKPRQLVEDEGRRCPIMSGDMGDRKFCKKVIQKTVQEFGRLNILVNNAAEQHPAQSPEEINLDFMEKTFRTNIFPCFI